MARARLEATVGLKTGAFRRGVARLTRFASNAGKRIAGAFRVGRNIFFGITAGLAAIAVVGAKAVKTFISQRTELAKLAAVQKATGFASGFTTGELDDQAKSLSKLTGISKESINQTQAVLATFKNISGKEFEEATQAILDMSVVLDQDAKQGAIQLGKALNDPIKGITALSRVGVSFTEQQKQQIKALAEAGKLEQAQAIILKELKSEFGGAAEAVNKIDGGLANLKEAFAQAIGQFGEGIVTSNSFSNAVATLTDAIDKLSKSGALQVWAENVIKSFKLILPLVDKLKSAFGAVSDAVEKAGAFVGAFSAQTGSMKERLSAAVDAAKTANDRMAEVRSDRAKKIQEDRSKVREDEDKKDREQMKQNVGGAGAGLAAKKESFSSLRRIGANMIKSAGGRNIPQQQLTVLQQMQKELQEQTQALKDRATQRGVF
jgi:hypothetical protein